MEGKKTVRIAATGMELVKIDELVPYARNAKIHSADQIAKIRASLREYGFVAPVLIDREKNVIAGHGRIEAARAEGMEEIPCVLAEGLSDAQRRAYIIAGNRLTEIGAWDMAQLRIEMDELQGMSFDVQATGFEMGEIPGLTVEDDERGKDAEEDDFDAEPHDGAKVQRGELWKLGRHRLLIGSTADETDVIRLMNGAKANMVFTDPPYGVAIGDKNKFLDGGGKSGRCTENIAGDTMSEQDLHDMLLNAMRNLRQSCAEDASYYVTSPQGGSLGLMMMMMMREAGLEVRHMLIWRKNAPTFSMGRLDYEYQHEPIFYTWTKKHVFYGGGEFKTSIWDVEKPRKCDLHPTMKPIRLIANALKNSTREGDIVLDGFGGSGSTLIACEQLDRTCYTMEIDPKYAQVIIDRWEALTGEKAVLLDDDA